jgi:hypothetical protein
MSGGNNGGQDKGKFSGDFQYDPDRSNLLLETFALEI